MAGVQASIRTFIAPPVGPGRLAPTFLFDLTIHDPAHRPPSSANFLAGPLLPFGREIVQVLAAGSCRHSFCTKDRQTSVPAIDARPQADSVYRVAAICSTCRWHIDLKVDYSVRWKDDPCPNAKNPLHHLVRSPSREQLAQTEWQSTHDTNPHDMCVFECSSTTCSATVTVSFRPPVLDDMSVRVLTDKVWLGQRTDAAFAKASQGTEGMKRPLPVDVLTDLRTYLRNAWTKEVRMINLDNKRFMVRFGPDGYACKDVLQSIGFTLKPNQGWDVPKPNPEDTQPLQSSKNIFLDDVDSELCVLILQRPAEERQQAHDNSKLRDALPDFARSLSCQDYDKAPSARRDHGNTKMPPNLFINLGAPEDGDDSIVLYAYQRQCATAPLLSPRFLTYLCGIAKDRNSEFLSTEIALEYSKGNYDSEQLRIAYSYFGFNWLDMSLDDGHIIGAFLARLQDSPRQETEMRENLRIIGNHRQSKNITDTASNSINTYEQALDYLNCDASTQDDFITAMYTTKVSEDASTIELARKAVAIIAESRKSKPLKDWLQTGELEEPKMDIGTAYSMFNIDDRTIDDDVVYNAYSIAVSDNPAQTDQYSKAIQAIAESRQSMGLQQLLTGGHVIASAASAETPVGLENIGNTCYLNSLLQFFFTVPMLRNIVINNEMYLMALHEVDISAKKVGRRSVTLREVQTAQKFVGNLGALFREMITSPRASITPQQELARLTLATSTAAEKIRRKSTIASGGRPSLGHIDSIPPPNGILDDEAVQSPTDMTELNGFRNSGAPRSEVAPTKLNQEFRPTATEVDVDMLGDNSSEATLVSIPSMEDDANPVPNEVRSQQQHILENKENFSPVKEAAPWPRPASPVKALSPLGSLSPSRLNIQAGALATSAEDHDKMALGDQNPEAEAAEEPPPIPPRPLAPAPSTPMLEEYARQQDVAEVMGHCLFQLSCAIRATGVDKTGEQLDEIHDLFYGTTQSHVIPEDVSHSVEDMFSSIIARLSMKPKDIYAALDGYFDVEEMENGPTIFQSITRPPPIFAIHLDRVGFDAETKSYRKVNHHVELKETIFLDRYLEDGVGSAQMERRRQTWELKKELAQLTARKEELEETLDHPNAPTVFQDAMNTLVGLQSLLAEHEYDDLFVKPQTIDTLSAMAEQTRTELKEINNKLQLLEQSINSNFTDMRRHPYRLHAAFFHRGTQGAGHYWVYIYDFKREMWRKYNDSYVTDVKDTNEIFARPTDAEMKAWAGPANPYFLVYVQDGSKDTLVESVHREIAENPFPAIQPQIQPQAQPQALALASVPTPANYNATYLMDKARFDADTQAYGEAAPADTDRNMEQQRG